MVLHPLVLPIAVGGLLLGGLGYWLWSANQGGGGAAGSANALYGAANQAAQYIQQNGAGSGTNGGVVANFQQIWNSSGGTPQIQVDDIYGPCTQAAMASVLGTAPAQTMGGTCTNGTYTPPAGTTQTGGSWMSQIGGGREGWFGDNADARVAALAAHP